jgi:hypothetical protein
MAPHVTHLVIGERVFPMLRRLQSGAYGPFLLGCILVDVHGFSDINRRRTHLVGTLAEEGTSAFTTSCTRFLDRRGELLLRPWEALSGNEQAFIAGYLCHLAVDEIWREFGWEILQALDVTSPDDLPMPVDVIMMALSVLSGAFFLDFAAVSAALEEVAVPDLLMHVPRAAFQTMWDVAHEHVLQWDRPESFYEMLERLGKPDAEVQRIRQQQAAHWEEAVKLLGRFGGVERIVQSGVDRSVKMVPRLWD